MRAAFKLGLVALVPSVVVFLMLTILTAPGSCTELDNALNSTARVYNGNYYGSAAVYHIDDKLIHLITCGHTAIQNGRPLQVQFFVDGKSSKWFSAIPYWVVNQEAGGLNDMALIQVDRVALNSYPLPTALELDLECTPQPDDVAISCGARNGLWPALVRGRFTKRIGRLLRFWPNSQKGQSGSAVLNGQGKIVGIVVQRNAEQGAGAVPLTHFVKHKAAFAPDKYTPPPRWNTAMDIAGPSAQTEYYSTGRRRFGRRR